MTADEQVLCARICLAAEGVVVWLLAAFMLTGCFNSDDLPEPGPGSSETDNSETDAGDTLDAPACADNHPGQTTGVTWGPCCEGACNWDTCVEGELGDVCEPLECEDIVGFTGTLIDATGAAHVFVVDESCHVPCEDGVCPAGMVCDDAIGGCVWL